jgi:cytoskeletal protein CcmA (bactofilin family)
MFGIKKDEKEKDQAVETAPASTPEAPQQEIAPPPLKPFAKSGSHHAGSKPPSAPTRNAEVSRRVTDIPGAPRRSTGRSGPNEDGGKRLTVGRDICLSGEISACEKLVVEGSVEAQLTDASMIEVASTGTFKGTAEVENADISGLYDGDLTVRGRVTIRPGGQIKGKVRYGVIVIEAGGQVNGQMEALPDTSGDDDDGDQATSG